MSVVTRKGQITIPAEIRRALNIAEGDKVAFILEEGGVKLSRTGSSVVGATAGALRSDMLVLSAEEERHAVEKAIAEDVVARMDEG